MTSDSPQTVRRPRTTDIVGSALRQVYVGSTALPQDMAQLLERLSRN